MSEPGLALTPPDMPIDNISDTARWVAVYRAMETERPDAIFRDPFAATLAGDKGASIADTMKRGRQMAWAVIVRTAVFDEIIMARIREGADLVVNLAAGLDARPWRLPLPSSLRWVDVDLPDILRYKSETIGGATPVCRYETASVDLTDAPARRALFARLGAGSRSALVVTEGLLIYLTAEQVGELASDLHAAASFRWWLFDLANPALLKIMLRLWGRSAQAGNAQFRFAPAEGTGFFRRFGWRELAYRSNLVEAKRLQREMSLHWLWRLVGSLTPPARRPEAGCVLTERM